MAQVFFLQYKIFFVHQMFSLIAVLNLFFILRGGKKVNYKILRIWNRTKSNLTDMRSK